MDKKLTLSLDQNIIERAKIYARSNNISVSKLIEAYLNSLTTKSNDIEITPLVESLSGVINLPDNDQKDYTDYLMDKYK
ncbi:hypothetical protein KZP23_14585 [Echinicola marina]|uniref:DUF6364 family protein n=1 Tax=Echinicola marina TaxID=2859768 RepID=UPI001CF606F4|nr:DUF6364 family protein [Echinicola marina]UCS91949.1 hypothetical protein KZP23_14585 [Echinicola marina]